MNRIELHIDWKTKTLVILHSKGNIQLEIDNSGNTEITEETLKVMDTKVIDVYEDIIAEILKYDEDRITILYNSWGSDSSIIIGSTANVVGIDNKLAKQLIMQGVRHGILYQSSSYVWKIKDDTIQSRWLGKVKDVQKESKPEKDMTLKGSMDRYAEKAKELGLKGFESYATGEGGMIANKGMIVNEKTVEVIPEITIPTRIMPTSLVSVESLKNQLSKYKAQYYDPEFVESEVETKNTLLAKINTLKVQITNAEITQSQGQYTQGAKITTSGNVTKIERVEQKGVQKKESDTFRFPQKKIPTKGKPSPRSPVVKKK